MFISPKHKATKILPFLSVVKYLLFYVDFAIFESFYSILLACMPINFLDGKKSFVLIFFRIF